MAEYLYPNARIAIFAKAPIAGQVKTRMQPALSEQQSAQLQALLITHTLSTAINSQIAPVQLWCAPDTQHPAFQVGNIELKQQMGADLGERMRAAFLENTYLDFTLLIGTDCPLLTAKDLGSACRNIQTNTVCLQPAQDGGYVLIASRETPKCFDGINWGSEKVLSQSLSALAAEQQSVGLLSTLPDLDHPQDLAALPDTIASQLKALELRKKAQDYLR